MEEVKEVEDVGNRTKDVKSTELLACARMLLLTISRNHDDTRLRPPLLENIASNCAIAIFRRHAVLPDVCQVKRGRDILKRRMTSWTCGDHL